MSKPRKSTVKSSAKPTARGSNIALGSLKEPFYEWCEANGKKPSAVIRELIAKEMAGQGASAPKFKIEEGEGETAASKKRRELKLTPSEDEAVNYMADLEGYSPQRWIIALIRARLTGAPEFNDAEAQALVRSTTQVAAIGRNLNQIAKALNANLNEAKYFRVDMIEALEKLIKDHTMTVSKLVAANVDRWRVKP